MKAAGQRLVYLDYVDYWATLEEIALEHLLLFEEESSGLDRDDWFVGPAEPDE